MQIIHGVHGFARQMEHFLTDMSNRVEHQKEPKRPPLCGRLGSFWCSTRLLMSVKKCASCRGKTCRMHEIIEISKNLTTLNLRKGSMWWTLDSISTVFVKKTDIVDIMVSPPAFTKI